MKSSEFIFMLTRADRTVADAMDRVREVQAAGVVHIGFKDVGLPIQQLRLLADSIRAGGGSVYLEVVSLDEPREVASARAAVELKVDYLLGGTRPDVVLPIIRDLPIKYYPFAGHVSGHPSVLSGTIDEITDSARRLCEMPGVHGVDLLAYRFVGDVPALLRSVAQVGKPIIVAGSGPFHCRPCAGSHVYGLNPTVVSPAATWTSRSSVAK